MLLGERTNSRNNNFDILRFFAALHVLILHGVLLFGNDNQNWFVALNGVAVFFIISGFLVTRSWCDNPNIFAFLKKRILRIFPALIAVVLFTALILGPIVTTLPLKEYFTDSAFFNYFKNIFLYEIYHLLPGVFQNNPLNESECFFVDFTVGIFYVLLNCNIRYNKNIKQKIFSFCFSSFYNIFILYSYTYLYY